MPPLEPRPLTDKEKAMLLMLAIVLLAILLAIAVISVT